MGFVPISPSVGGGAPAWCALPYRVYRHHIPHKTHLLTMGRRKEKKKERQHDTPPSASGPWLSQRSGLIGMTALSLVLTGWTAWQIHEFKPWSESILWGLGFGVAIWLVFGLAYAFSRWARGKS